MSKDRTVTEGSGNVFADLGMPDAAGELVKAQLSFQIAKGIKALGLTHTAAAARLGISQPDVSRLMRRRPTGFSTDRLLALLTALHRGGHCAASGARARRKGEHSRRGAVVTRDISEREAAEAASEYTSRHPRTSPKHKLTFGHEPASALAGGFHGGAT